MDSYPGRERDRRMKGWRGAIFEAVGLAGLFMVLVIGLFGILVVWLYCGQAGFWGAVVIGLAVLSVLGVLYVLGARLLSCRGSAAP